MQVEVTPEMANVGARMLRDELGFQFTPDWMDGEELVGKIFLAMLAMALEPIEEDS